MASSALALRSAEQPHQGIPCRNRRSRRAWVSPRASAVHFASGNTGDANLWPLLAPNRAVTIPDGNGRTNKGCSRGEREKSQVSCPVLAVVSLCRRASLLIAIVGVGSYPAIRSLGKKRTGARSWSELPKWAIGSGFALQYREVRRAKQSMICKLARQSADYRPRFDSVFSGSVDGALRRFQALACCH